MDLWARLQELCQQQSDGTYKADWDKFWSDTNGYTINSLASYNLLDQYDLYLDYKNKYTYHIKIKEKKMSDVSPLIGLINEAMIEAKKLAEQVGRGIGGREVSLTITKLEEARHRAVDTIMLLEGLGEDPQQA